ncbi:putative ribonuclease H-like domain-containing protein [Tanacetum coccineum]
MTSNKAYLVNYQDYNGGPVAFGGSKGYITGKGKIRTRKLDFEDVCFVKELQLFNLFSFSQKCDKKNKVLFTESECLVLSLNFKMPDENQVLLRVPRQNNMYSFKLENIIPSGGLTCLIAKATVDKSNKWHRRDIIELYGSKGIKREYSNARTPQQIGVAERKNRTLIEAARTMLADSFLPNTFWAEAVSTACYVLNRFDGKSDEGFLVGYSLNSKAFRVYNLETKRVEENLHINFLENKPNVAGKGPTWLFDLDYLTDSMNYQPVRLENQANKTTVPKEVNHSTGTQDNIDAGNSKIEAEPAQEHFVLPIWSFYTLTIKISEAKKGGEKPKEDAGSKSDKEPVDQEDQVFLEELERLKRQENEANLLLQAGAARATNDSQIPALEDMYENPSHGIFTNASYDDEGAVADFTNLETTVIVSPILTSRIHYIHLKTQILEDPTLAIQTRSKVNKSSRAHALKISEALEDESWVDAMQEELLQFKIQKLEIRQEEGIDYNEVFAPVAKIEAIKIFLAFASYMGFIVYQMDVKSAFLYGTIDEEMYVSQPLCFIDPKYPKKVYKVVKALYGLHQAPRAWYATLSAFLLKSGYRRGTIDKTLSIRKDNNDIVTP